MLLLPRQIFNNPLLTAEVIKSPNKHDLCTVLYSVLWGRGGVGVVVYIPEFTFQIRDVVFIQHNTQ
jgi:hypothetical protein